MDSRSIMSMMKMLTKTKPSMKGGMADTVPGQITGTGEPVQVSEGEYIIPADVVSMLGDGNTEAGAEMLDKMVEQIRMKKGKHLAKGKQAKGLADLFG